MIVVLKRHLVFLNLKYYIYKTLFKFALIYTSRNQKYISCRSCFPQSQITTNDVHGQTTDWTKLHRIVVLYSCPWVLVFCLKFTIIYFTYFNYYPSTKQIYKLIYRYAPFFSLFNTYLYFIKFFYSWLNNNNSSTESEGFMGKSQNETLLYWPTDSEVNNLFIVWLFAFFLQAHNWPVGITGE